MMQTTLTYGQQAFVRALPTWGPAFTVAAGSTSAFVDATPIARRVTDVAVLADAFPGTSVWRPPN